MVDPHRTRSSDDPLARRYRGAPPYTPRRPPGGLGAERRRPARTRRRLFTEARALHATSATRIGEIDAAIEALVDQRLACLDVLVDCRDQLRPRWSSRHSRRRNSVDEAPFPEPPPGAKPVWGIDLRSLALTLLRRHGPQRLRDLHALIHLHGYCIDSARPVQRLGDAMAYELEQGRVERLERGVYGATGSNHGPPRYVPPTTELGTPLPWDRPVTDPPLLDPDLAVDPELWSGGQWPTEPDPPHGDQPEPDDPAHGSAIAPAAAASSEHDGPTTDTPADPAHPPERMGGDSPANRRPLPPASSWREWEPPP